MLWYSNWSKGICEPFIMWVHILFEWLHNPFLENTIQLDGGGHSTVKFPSHLRT